MNRGPALSALEVTKHFGVEGREPIHVIDSLTFEQPTGEFLAVVGPSGCGKTTLLRIIAGLVPPDDGTIRCLGEPLEGPAENASIVFQDYNRSLFPWLNVRKNVTFGMSRSERTKRADRVTESLEQVGLQEFEEYYPWQLSGGMQQRVALARSLVSGAQLLLLDEPFASVDAQTRIDLQSMVLDICATAGMTTLLVTHDIDEAVLMADRILVLSSRPASIIDDVDVQLPRPRDHLETVEMPAYSQARHRVFQLVRKAQADDEGV